MNEGSFELSELPLSLADLSAFVFAGPEGRAVNISASARARILASEKRLQDAIQAGVPIYGVSTGFGDSVSRLISTEHAAQLQNNLVQYLLCGTGAMLSVDIARATLAIRLKSFCNGYSGISLELAERMALFLENDWLPVIPSEGSLGASGDLIPLAYLANVLQGQGQIYCDGKICEAADVLEDEGLDPYILKPKEGLALVNGTTVMAAHGLVNVRHARYLCELACVATSWLDLALKGRTEPFGALVNELASRHTGQSQVAGWIRDLLEEEGHRPTPLNQISAREGQTSELVQDRYSLRCTPQILGPVLDTISLFENWLTEEINGTSDNPLLGEQGELAMGGNFYGGYLSQGTDYLKISLANMADLIDRQLMTIIDEKSNRGLPPNLANWPGLPPDERSLHHGLKGLHQAVGAITSEIHARAIPNSIFSRSSESHNQDKVSLGMSAAIQCAQMTEPLFTITAMYLICLTQALDLRGVKVKGKHATDLYNLIRLSVPFVENDQSLASAVKHLRAELKFRAETQGKVFDEKY